MPLSLKSKTSPRVEEIRKKKSDQVAQTKNIHFALLVGFFYSGHRE